MYISICVSHTRVKYIYTYNIYTHIYIYIYIYISCECIVGGHQHLRARRHSVSVGGAWSRGFQGNPWRVSQRGTPHPSNTLAHLKSGLWMLVHLFGVRRCDRKMSSQSHSRRISEWSDRHPSTAPAAADLEKASVDACSSIFGMRHRDCEASIQGNKIMVRHYK